MGCDIHIVLEKKVKTTMAKNVWHICNNFRVDEDDDFDEVSNPKIRLETSDMGFRNYECFGLLAGIRSDEDPFIEPRGLPKDCHKYTREEFEKHQKEYCYHTPSWYSMKELIEFVDGLKPDSEDSFSCKSEYLDYTEYFNTIKHNMVQFVETIVDYVYRFFEVYVKDEGLTDIQYFYQDCAEKYRIVFWFDS